MDPGGKALLMCAGASVHGVHFQLAMLVRVSSTFDNVRGKIPCNQVSYRRNKYQALCC